MSSLTYLLFNNREWNNCFTKIPKEVSQNLISGKRSMIYISSDTLQCGPVKLIWLFVIKWQGLVTGFRYFFEACQVNFDLIHLKGSLNQTDVQFFAWLFLELDKFSERVECGKEALYSQWRLLVTFGLIERKNIIWVC